MPEQSKNNKEYTVPDYQADLVQIMKSLFKRKWLVASITLAAVLISLVLSLVLPKVYRSAGFFQLSEPSREKPDALFSVATQLLDSSRVAILSQLKDLGILEMLRDLKIELPEPENFFVITLQDFKKYASAINDYQKFLDFVKGNNLLEEDLFQQLKNNIKDAEQFSRLFKEVYALSRDDFKNVGQSLLQEKNYIVGLEMEMEADRNDTARQFLTLLGEFIQYRIIAERINDYITSYLNEFQILTARYDNYILDNRSALQHLKNEKAKIQALVKQYPDFSKKETLQLLDMQENSQRYLSLMTQLIGIESRIVSLETLIDQLELEKSKSLLFTTFFDYLRENLWKHNTSGEALLQEMKRLTAEFFKDKNLEETAIRVVHNTIGIDMQRLRMLFFKTLRFISGPNLPEKPTWPRKSIFLVFGFVFGLIISLFAAFFLEFWNRNKALIKQE